MSSAVHSHRVLEITDTASPGMTPRAMSPFANATTLSRNSTAVNDRHSPVSGSLYSMRDRSGVRPARSSSIENRLLSVSIDCSNGIKHSVIIAFPLISLGMTPPIVPCSRAPDARRTAHRRDTGLSAMRRGSLIATGSR